MSTSDASTHRLRVQGVEATLQVSVIDNADRIRATAFGEDFDVRLPRGIYTLRTERDGRVADKLVRVDKDREAEPARLDTYSPILLPGAATTHEYYTYRAWDISQNPTAPEILWAGDTSSALMLFIRALDMRAHPFAYQADNLVLQSLGGPLSDLAEGDAVHDPQYGFTAWHARMSPGLVILEDRGERPRQVPVRLVPGFQTQVFVMHQDRPMLEDMRVLNVPFEDLEWRGGRDPYERGGEFAATYEHIDAGLVALNNAGADIADRLVSKFLNSKFKNPLLGLIGAYLMLMRTRAGQSDGDKTNLARIVIGNLGKLMPGAADIAALKILAEPLLGPPSLEPIEDIPLFRAGTDAVLDRAATDPSLIPGGSLLDVVSDILIEDSVWTSWEPVPLPLPDHWERPMRDDMSWVELAIAEAVADAPAVLDASNLAKRIGVTQFAVKDAYANLVNRAAQRPSTLDVEGLDVSRMKRGLFNRVDAELIAPLRPQLSEISKDTKISYQQVYPELKNVMAAYPGKRKDVRASDPVELVVEDWGEPNVRQDIFRKLERNFAVDLADVEQRIGSGATVRDIASIVVKKSEF